MTTVHISERQVKEYLQEQEIDIPLFEYRTFKTDEFFVTLSKSENEYIKIYTLEKGYCLGLVEIHNNDHVEVFLFGKKYENRIKYEFFSYGGLTIIMKNGGYLGYRRKAIGKTVDVSPRIEEMRKAIKKCF